MINYIKEVVMKNSFKLFVILIGFSFVFFSCESNSPVTPVSTNSTNNPTYIVTIQSDGNSIQSNNIESDIQQIFAEHNIAISSLVYTYSTVLKGFAAQLSDGEVASLKSDKKIVAIEKDQEYQLIDKVESIDDAKGNKVQSQSIPWGINYIGGFTEATSATGVAWIVDTGVDLDHPDLNVNLNLSKTMYTSGTDAVSADDLNGHGSHVAGIIAAKNNSIGVVGVCAGAQVIAVKVLNYRGCGAISTIVAGLDYVGSHLVSDKINVVNLSLGGSVSTALDNSVKNLAGLGAYLVLAACNSSNNVLNYSPARVEATRVYTISSHNSQGVFSTFSNYGNPSIDFAAPGENIYSTYKNGGYATMSGTSMSAPHVSGILLANNGVINWSGYVTADKDGYPDKKAKR